MKRVEFVLDKNLAAIAKKSREAAGKTKADAAREMGVKEPAILYAEENPEKSFRKLRCRMIEAYSQFTVTGPWFRLEKK